MPNNNVPFQLDDGLDVGTAFSVDVISGISSAGKLDLTSSSPVSLSLDGQPLKIGSSSGVNLVMDTSAIQSRNNGLISRLLINPDGGDVEFIGINNVSIKNDGEIYNSGSFKYWHQGSIGVVFDENVSLQKDLSVVGNLSVTGTTNITGITASPSPFMSDPIFTMGQNATDDNKDHGIEFKYNTGSIAKTGFFGYTDLDGKLRYFVDSTRSGADVISGTLGSIVASSFEGVLVGNADTATKLTTGRTISLSGDVTGTSQAFDGSSNVSMVTVIADDSHNHTSVSSDFVVSGTTVSTSSLTGALIVSGGVGFGGDLFVGGTIHGTFAGSVSTATALSTPRNIAILGAGTAAPGVLFDGSSDISLNLSVDHDAITNYVANEHIDWTVDQGATNISAGNYTNTVYNHPNHTGDVTSAGDGATLIGSGKVTLAKMATMSTSSLIGRTSAGTGTPQILSTSAARGLLNVEDGATADQTAAEIEGIVSHNNLLNFSANEHKDHSLISIATGNGLSGGGTIAATRTLSVNFAGTGTAITASKSDHNHIGTYDNYSNWKLAASGTAGTSTISTGVTATITAGGAISATRVGANITISHTDTSTLSNITNLTGATVISSLGFDTYGHTISSSTRNLTIGDIGAAATSHNHTSLSAGLAVAGILSAQNFQKQSISITAADNGNWIRLFTVGSSGRGGFIWSVSTTGGFGNPGKITFVTSTNWVGTTEITLIAGTSQSTISGIRCQYDSVTTSWYLDVKIATLTGANTLIASALAADVTVSPPVWVGSRTFTSFVTMTTLLNLENTSLSLATTGKTKLGGTLSLPNNTSVFMDSSAGADTEILRLDTSDQLIVGGDASASIIQGTAGRSVFSSTGSVGIESAVDQILTLQQTDITGVGWNYIGFTDSVGTRQGFVGFEPSGDLQLLSEVSNRFVITTNPFKITNTSDSTSLSTGALRVSGGSAISLNLSVGKDILVTGTDRTFTMTGTVSDAIIRPTPTGVEFGTGNNSNVALITNNARRLIIDATGDTTLSANLIVTGDILANGNYLIGDGKRIVQYNDTWMRLNPFNEFTTGIYCGTGLIRTDGTFQIGGNGATLLVNTSNLKYLSNDIFHAGTHDNTLSINSLISNRSTATPDTIGDTHGLNLHYMNSAAVNNPPGTDHSLLTMSFSSTWQSQLAADWRQNKWFVRVQNSGSWMPWEELLTASGVLSINDTTSSTSSSTGALVVAGGAGFGGDLNVASSGVTRINLTSASNPILTLKSTLAAADQLITFDAATATDWSIGNAVSSGAFVIGTGNNLSSSAKIIVSPTLFSSNIPFNMNDSTNSTSSSTGSLHTLGGIGVTKDLFVGGNILTSSLGQSLATIKARNAGPSLEFGHINQAGYASTIGAFSANGHPIITFCSMNGTNSNTMKTTGLQGSLVEGWAGEIIFKNVPAINSDNQVPVDIFKVKANGDAVVYGNLSASGVITGNLAGTGAFVNGIPSVSFMHIPFGETAVPFTGAMDATLGALWGINITNQPSDTALLNANTTPADIGYTGALDADKTSANTSADTALVSGIAALTVKDGAAKADLGFDASGFLDFSRAHLNKGAFATLSFADWSTQITGTGKPADNADVTNTSTLTYLDNPDFEGDDKNVISGASIINDPANAYLGSWVGEFSQTVAANVLNTRRSAVHPGQRFLMSTMVKGGTAGTVQSRVFWQDAAGAQVGLEDSVAIAAGSTVYQETRLIASVPTGAVQAQFGIVFQGPPTGIWYLDARRVTLIQDNLDINALLTTNAPAAAGADVTSANTSADTARVNAVLAATVQGHAQTGYDLTQFNGTTIDASSFGTLSLLDLDPTRQVKLDGVAALADVTGSNTALDIANQGAFATKSFADWSTEITGIGKPEDDASSAPFNLVGTTNKVLITGRTIEKIAGVGYDAQVYSKESYTGGAYASFTTPNTTNRVMVALNSDPLLDASFTSLDYAIFIVLNPGPVIIIYENGVSTLSVPGAYAVGDSFSIIYDGWDIKYYHNGVLIYTSLVSGINKQLFLDSTFFNIGDKITNLDFGPLSSSNWQGVIARPVELIDGRILAGFNSGGFLDFSRAHLNKSLLNVDPTANTKLIGVATGATKNTGALANKNDVNLAGSFVIGTLPSTKASALLQNASVGMNANGTLSGAGAGAIDALLIANGPVAAGADVTSANTSADTTMVSGIAALTVTGNAQTGFDLTTFNGTTIDASSFGTLSLFDLDPTRQVKLDGVAPLADVTSANTSADTSVAFVRDDFTDLSQWVFSQGLTGAVSGGVITTTQGLDSVGLADFTLSTALSKRHTVTIKMLDDQSESGVVIRGIYVRRLNGVYQALGATLAFSFSSIHNVNWRFELYPDNTVDFYAGGVLIFQGMIPSIPDSKIQLQSEGPLNQTARFSTLKVYSSAVNRFGPDIADSQMYSDDTSIEDLKPATKGADVTSANTSFDTTNVSGIAALTVKDGAAKADLGLSATGDINKNIKSGILVDQGNGVGRAPIIGLDVGDVLDGDVVTFPIPYGVVPTIRFLPSGLTNQTTLTGDTTTAFTAQSLTSTGFTADLKLKALAGTPTTHSDTTAIAGSHTFDKEKTNVGASWSNDYRFNVSVVLGTGPEPLAAMVDVLIKKTSGGVWVVYGNMFISGTFTQSGSLSVNVAGVVDFAGAQFAVDLNPLSDPGVSISSFDSVVYQTATAPVSVSATPVGVSPVPYMVMQ